MLGEITREITETRGLLAGCLFTSVEEKKSLKYSGREKIHSLVGRTVEGGDDVVAKPLAFSHSVVCLHLDEMKCQGRCGGPVTISVAANTPASRPQASN